MMSEWLFYAKMINSGEDTEHDTQVSAGQHVLLCVCVCLCEHTNECDVIQTRWDWIAHPAAYLSFSVIGNGNQWIIVGD